MKSKKIGIIAVLMVVCLFIGFGSALVINTLSPHFMGFWTSKENNTSLQVVSMEHKILTSDTVRTTVKLYNPSASPITFNATVTYMSGTDELLNYVISDTINAGQTKTYVNKKTFDLSHWDNTGIFIEATL